MIRVGSYFFFLTHFTQPTKFNTKEAGGQNFSNSHRLKPQPPHSTNLKRKNFLFLDLRQARIACVTLVA
jgi:hypothetical protein